MHPISTLQVPIDRLEAWTRDRLNQMKIQKTLEIRIRRVEEGYSSAGIYRITLLTQLENGETQELTVIQKYTTASELHILQELHHTITSPAIPPLIACQDAENGQPAWYVIPFYSGGALTWDDEMPDVVIRLLAQMHVRFEQKVKELRDWPGLRLIDLDGFNQTVSRAVQAVEGAVTGWPDDPFAPLLQQTKSLQNNPELETILALLPQTLTHGDIHPGNITRSENGRFVLLDWGSASLAPAMLDIPNMIEIGSREWDVYLSVLQEEQGTPVDPRLAELGYLWATVHINMNYLPFVVANRAAAHALKMIQKALDAQAKISQLSVG